MSVFLAKYSTGSKDSRWDWTGGVEGQISEMEGMSLAIFRSYF